MFRKLVSLRVTTRSRASLLACGLLLAGLVVPIQMSSAAADPFAPCANVVPNQWSKSGQEANTLVTLPAERKISVAGKRYQYVHYNVDGIVWFDDSADATEDFDGGATAISVANLDWTTAGDGWVGSSWADGYPVRFNGSANSMCVVWSVSRAGSDPSEITTLKLLLSWDSSGTPAEARTLITGGDATELNGDFPTSSKTMVSDLHYFQLNAGWRIPFQSQITLLADGTDGSATSPWMYTTPGNGQIAIKWSNYSGPNSTFAADVNDARTGKFIGSCSAQNPSVGCTVTGLTNQTMYYIASRRFANGVGYFTDSTYETPFDSKFQVWSSSPTVTAEDQACVSVANANYGATIRISGALSLTATSTSKDWIDGLCHDMVVKPGKYTITAVSGKAKATTTLWVADAVPSATVVKAGSLVTVKVTGVKPGSLVVAQATIGTVASTTASSNYAQASSSGTVNIPLGITKRGRSTVTVYTGLYDMVDQFTVKGY